jgi:hypothetical protein
MRTLRPSAGRTARSGQVLIVLLGGLLLGGSAAAGCHFLTGRTASEVNKALKQSVEDTPRKKAARAVVKHWSEDAKGFLKRTEKRRKSLLELIKRYETQRSAIEAKFAEQDADVDRATGVVLDRRFVLRGELPAEYWSAVFPAPKAE